MSNSKAYDIPLFIDSGAHSLYNEHVRGSGKGFGGGSYEWYRSQEFWDYVDRYAQFVHKNKHVLSVYANVDVIGHPEYTYDVQRYLEDEWDLRPLPVVHYGTDLKYLQRYIEEGHDYIAIGGLGQEITISVYREWADRVFDYICDKKTRLPQIKIHGFALTSHKLMTRYPWYSIDSTSWIQYAAFGQIIRPLKRNGKWVYDEPFLLARVSPREIKGGTMMSMLNTLKKAEKDVFLEYIEEKGYELGKSRMENGQEVIEEEGLCNNSNQRCELNALYFYDLVNALPEWPWPFKKKTNSLNLRC